MRRSRLWLTRKNRRGHSTPLNVLQPCHHLSHLGFRRNTGFTWRYLGQWLCHFLLSPHSFRLALLHTQYSFLSPEQDRTFFHIHAFNVPPHIQPSPRQCASLVDFPPFGVFVSLDGQAVTDDSLYSLKRKICRVRERGSFGKISC